MSSEVVFEVRGPVLIITFNRPEQGNALTPTMARTISEKLKAVSEDRTLRALLIRGNGDHFMNGCDMSMYVGDTNTVQEQIFQKIQFFYTTIREFQTMERPVIAAVNGRISNAGFSMMLAADLVIAADDAIFNAGFTEHAMVPDGGATFFLARKIGAARASEVFMLSEDFTAEQAKKWGLVTRVVAPEALQEEALRLAEKIATGPTRILGATKRLINKSFEQDLNAHLSIEATTWSASAKTFDFREAMKAYAAKREPKFSGS